MGLRGKTLFITGATRGIGHAIALRAARDGANIAIAAKTAEPHPKLPGTIYTAAADFEREGGSALPLVTDIRDEMAIASAVDATVDRFGGIDICINNASAISVAGTLATEMKRYDLMHQINGRGTFAVCRACIPHLQRSTNPHVLAISPPLDFRPEWFAPFPAYAVAKYNMSLYMMAMAAEFRSEGIAFNALWPRTPIATSAVKFGAKRSDHHSRSPAIMADAAYAILNRPARSFTGRFILDDEVLWEEGVEDFSQYSNNGDEPLSADLFVDVSAWAPPGVTIA